MGVGGWRRALVVAMASKSQAAFEAKAAKKNAKARKARGGAQFGIHETVYCFHGPLLYEAKVRG